MAIPTANSVILAASGNPTAADELRAYLHQKVSKQDTGQTTAQENQKFINALRQYADKLDKIIPDVHEYLNIYGASETPKSPDDPKLPNPNSSMTKESIPKGSDGTSNPLFNLNPMAIMFKLMLSFIDMQGYMSKIQNKIGLNSMQLTKALGQDQAAAQLSEGQTQYNSLIAQANMDFTNAGLSFGSAAATLFGGLESATKNTAEIDEAAEDLSKAAQKSDLVKNLEADKKGLDALDKEAPDLAKEIADNQKKIPPKLKPGEAAVAQDQDALVQGQMKLKAKQSDIDFQADQDQITGEIDDINEQLIEENKNLKNLNKKLDEKQEEFDKISKQAAEERAKNKGPASDETEAKFNKVKAERDELFEKVTASQGKISTLNKLKDSKQAEIAINNRLRAIEDNIDDPANAAEKTNIQTEITKEKNSIAYRIDRDTRLTKQQKEQLLEQKQNFEKIEAKLYENNPAKLDEVLTNQQKTLETRQQLLKDNITSNTDKFNKEGLATDYEKRLLKQDKLDQLGEHVDGNQDKLKIKLSEARAAKFQQGWKLMSFNSMIEGARSLVSGQQKLIEAGSSLQVAQWKSLQTTYQMYQQNMQQNMSSMLDAQKGSLDVGAQFAQALSGISDKGTSILHWSG